MLASQLFEKASADVGDLDSLHAAGDFAPLLQWLQTNVHRHGRRYSGRALCEHVTGEPLSADALMRHLDRKSAMYYGV